jgi:cation diffusion facilitator CzcD-associated flavoprotein CzcO
VPDDTVLVIGAGPAGLATSRQLTSRGIDHVVLERGGSIAQVWEDLYDGLVLHTGKHLSSLPGMPFPASAPLFPTRRNFLDYLHRYAATFHVPVRTGTDVTAVERTADGWLARTASGDAFKGRALVVATGIVSNPQVPAFPGSDRFRGSVIHSVSYRTPGGFAGRRVLVVGAGNSAGEISVELAHAGASVTVAVRSSTRVVPRQLLGVPIQYFAVALASLPLAAQRSVEDLMASVSARLRGPSVLTFEGSETSRDRKCSNVPLIGFHLVDAIRTGRIRLKRSIAEFTEDGARFEDGSEEPFDDVIMATGYRAAVQMLGELISTDRCGFASRRSRVVSLDQPDLYFVGHNYDTQGGLRNIGRDATLVARHVSARPGRAPT